MDLRQLVRSHQPQFEYCLLESGGFHRFHGVPHNKTQLRKGSAMPSSVLNLYILPVFFVLPSERCHFCSLAKGRPLYSARLIVALCFPSPIRGKGRVGVKRRGFSALVPPPTLPHKGGGRKRTPTLPHKGGGRKRTPTLTHKGGGRKRTPTLTHKGGGRKRTPTLTHKGGGRKEQNNLTVPSIRVVASASPSRGRRNLEVHRQMPYSDSYLPRRYAING